MAESQASSFWRIALQALDVGHHRRIYGRNEDYCSGQGCVFRARRYSSNEAADSQIASVKNGTVRPIVLLETPTRSCKRLCATPKSNYLISDKHNIDRMLDVFVNE